MYKNLWKRPVSASCRNWLRFMFMVKLVIFLTLLNLHAAVAIGYSQRVTLDRKQISLQEAFREIRMQSGYNIIANTKLLKNSQKVDLALRNATVTEAVEKCLEGQELGYEIIAKNIVIKPIERYLEQQQRVISGIVRDAEGNAVAGATVAVKGSATAVKTDVEGHFSIQVSTGTILVISFLGMTTEEILVSNQTNLSVELKLTDTGLDEVVVVGYGTVKRSDVTGSISGVTGEQLRDRPVSNTFEALQGKVAGVDITSNERPGEIGQIYIRGIRSLTASNTPLYVVDGIPLMSSSGIETLNPADIESIDVLKDASATAIYGSRGANGVVIVTTKKGKAGRTTMNYSGAMVSETLQNRMKMMDADEYLTWRRWAHYYADPVNSPRGDQPTQANDYDIFLGGNDPYTWANIMRGWEGGTWDGSKVQNTDWIGMVTQTGITHEHNLSVSGGSEKSSAYGSFGYWDNKGTLKDQSYQRFTSLVNVDVKPFNWFEMGASLNTTYSVQQFGQSNTGGTVSGPNSLYQAATRIFSYAVPYDDNGERIFFPGGDDVIASVVNEWNYNDNERKLFRTLGSFYAQVNILEGLKYRVNFGPDIRNFKNGVFVDQQSVNRLGGTNLASLRNQNDFSWTLDNLIYYDKQFGKHNFGVTLLQTASSHDVNSSFIQATAIPLPSQKWNALNPANITSLNLWDSHFEEKQLMSYMGRVNYGFANKYLLTASGRWDGASQLADGHKWSFFPSMALAWRMDQEDWLQSKPWLNQLKLRLGVGTTGNSDIRPYQTKGEVVSLFYPFGSNPTAGYVPYEELITGGNLSMANKGLTWEKTTQYNFGLDYGIWDNRISGVVDVYTTRTKDLLILMNIPSLTGYTTTLSNIGETKNIGVDLQLNTANIRKDRFSWETTFNIGWQRDEIVSLANGKEDDISNEWFIGHSIESVYGYESNGIWQESDAEEMARFNANGYGFQLGLSRPVDQNGDYEIDPNYDRVIVGNARPRWTVGLTNNIRYGNFDFNFLIFGRLGYMYDSGGEWQGGRYNQRSIDYYNENNKDAEYQKPIFNVGGGDPYHRILGYKNGSFLKLRNINLGYRLPTSVASRLKVESLKIYGQVRNPGMLFSKVDWMDMDTVEPTWNRGFVFGVVLGF